MKFIAMVMRRYHTLALHDELCDAPECKKDGVPCLLAVFSVVAKDEWQFKDVLFDIMQGEIFPELTQSQFVDILEKRLAKTGLDAWEDDKQTYICAAAPIHFKAEIPFVRNELLAGAEIAMRNINASRPLEG